MTLVSSGVLHLTGFFLDPDYSIEHECAGTHTGFSLKAAQLVASSYVGSLPVSMSDFYSYEYSADPSTIVVDFDGGLNWITYETNHQDAYMLLVFTGRQPGDTITLNVNSDFTEVTPSVTLVVYYSINSTTVWNTIVSTGVTSDDDVTIPLVYYNDVVRIRINIEGFGGGVGTVTVTLTGGTFTHGSGTITAQGLTTFNLGIPSI